MIIMKKLTLILSLVFTVTLTCLFATSAVAKTVVIQCKSETNKSLIWKQERGKLYLRKDGWMEYGPQKNVTVRHKDGVFTTVIETDSIQIIDLIDFEYLQYKTETILKRNQVQLSSHASDCKKLK
jgi:hypothetical protein